MEQTNRSSQLVLPATVVVQSPGLGKSERGGVEEEV